MAPILTGASIVVGRKASKRFTSFASYFLHWRDGLFALTLTINKKLAVLHVQEVSTMKAPSRLNARRGADKRP